MTPFTTVGVARMSVPPAFGLGGGTQRHTGSSDDALAVVIEVAFGLYELCPGRYRYDDQLSVVAADAVVAEGIVTAPARATMATTAAAPTALNLLPVPAGRVRVWLR